MNYGIGNLPRVQGTNLVVNVTPIDVLAALDGTFSATIQGNDTITPNGTLYQVTLYAGGQVFLSANYSITGSTFDLNTATPLGAVPAVPPAQAYTTVDSAGVPLTQRQILNFLGSGVTCADNSSVSRTDCTFTGGAGATFQANGTNTLSQTTINWQSGTNITVSNPSAGNVRFDFSGSLPIASGGTGQTTAGAAFNALSPMTTLGDLTYGGPAPGGTGTRLGGNTTTTKQFLSQTGTGTASAPPAWAQPAFADLSGLATKGQLPGVTVYTDQANAYSSGFSQTLGAATTGAASLNVPAGTAPTSPTKGDAWVTDPGSNKDRQLNFADNANGFIDLLNHAITTARTYYVCAKANGGTCVYNGDAGTVAPTIADTNDCATKATPCATIAGVRDKILGKILLAPVTVQLADAAGTGTDCYRPNATAFENLVYGSETTATLEGGEINNNGSYPTAYLYVLGNTATPGNVIVTGSTTCAGTAATDTAGLKFSNTTARVRGIAFKNFANGANGPDTGAVVCYRSVCYVEGSNYTGAAGTGGGTLAVGWDQSIARLGGTITVTDGNVLDVLNESHGSFITPLGRSNLTVVVNTGVTLNGGLFTSNEKSHTGVDGISLSVTGAGTAIVWFAIAHSSINWNDAQTFTAPAQSVNIQGANFTIDKATQGSYIRDGCRTTGQLTCTIGTTTSVFRSVLSDTFSYVQYLGGRTATNPDSLTGGSFETATNGHLLAGSVDGISGTSTLPRNLRGSCTFAASTTCTVTFGVAEADANYFITLGPNANKTFWWSAKATTGFTINASASSSDIVDWHLIR